MNKKLEENAKVKEILWIGVEFLLVKKQNNAPGELNDVTNIKLPLAVQ